LTDVTDPDLDAPGRLRSGDQREDRDYVISLARGLSVIRSFDSEHLSMTLSEVAERAGMNRAATRRFLLTLVREGYASTDGRHFQLRPKIFDLGYSALASMSFADLASEAMQDLSATVDETCLAAVLDGYEVVYVAKTISQRVVIVNIDVGTRMPAFCMSTGRVLLAALADDELERWFAGFEPKRFTDKTITAKARLREAVAQAREDGYAVVDEEYEIGFRSLSVPIVGSSGRTVAALNICCPSARVSIETMRGPFLAEARASAEEIGRSLPEQLLRQRRRAAGASSQPAI
jgi:IclR family pca regulon transcriptional regulator